jgi:3-phosphoshikimate 1-carboxyvinyltransferase
MKILPVKKIAGELKLPGDKSISHRAAIIAALAEGQTRIRNFATGADCRSTLNCLRQLGVEIIEQDNPFVIAVIKGVGRQGFLAPGKPLDCGNSGTTFRLLAGALAGQEIEAALIGDESLSRRPMRRIIEPLAQMGAKIESNDGLPPLKIHGTKDLRAISCEMPVPSAQVKSCLLLAGLNAEGKTIVTEPAPTRDHTERMLRRFGADVYTVGNTISISGKSALTAGDIFVPGDISSAAFFIVAACCLPGSDLTIKDVGLNPTRTALLDFLRSVGANIEIAERSTDDNEPHGDLRVSAASFGGKKGVIFGAETAALIDELPILAVLGTQLPGGLEVRDAAQLRVKETDRIAAVVKNLRQMKASVTELPDGFRVERSPLKGARLDSFSDHRIAMAFAIAALLADGESEIANPACVEVSFPEFFHALFSLV